MGRPKGSKSKNKIVPLSEESKKKVEKGLQEAKEGKVEKIDLEKELTPLTKEQIERREKLKGVMRDINKNIEGANVDYANTISVRERQSFGYSYLDKLTGGGIVRGNTTVVWGSKGCGKTTIALKLIATAQAEGKIVAYLDVERSYDEIWAKSFGVDTKSLVYVICPDAESVMDAVIKLCKEKVVDVIVLDSVQGLSPHGEQYSGKGEAERSVQEDTMALLARKMSQFFRMATPHISEAQCALLLIGQARMDLSSFIKVETLSGGHALMHNSRLILRLRRGQGADAPVEKRPTGEKDKNGKDKLADVKIGFDLVITVQKSQIQGCTEGDSVHLPFYFKDGIHEQM